MHTYVTSSSAKFPDVVGSMERLLHVCDDVLSTIDNQGVCYDKADVHESMLNYLAGLNSLQSPWECVLQGLLPAAELILKNSILEASVRLAHETSIPASALRTSAGWFAALETDGIHIRDMRDLDRQKGTTIALAVKNIWCLTELRKTYSSRQYLTCLEDTYSTMQVSGATFDSVATSYAHSDFAGRLGWELIRLESEKHINLVWHQVNKYVKNYQDVESGDLLTWGWIGLRAALRHYNPKLGFAFSTYACTRIVGSIRDGIRAESPVPKRLGAMARIASIAEHELTQSLGRAPTMAELSLKSDIGSKHLEIIRRTKPAVSLNVLGDDDSSAPQEWLVSEENVEDSVISNMERGVLESALSNLPPDESQAVKLLVLDDLSTKEVCLLLGVTPRALRQRRDKGLERLRCLLDKPL